MNRSVAASAAVIAVIAGAAGAGALSAQTLDTMLAARSGTRLSVSNISGTVTIRSWGRNQIRVVAEYDRARVEVDESPGRVSVRTVSRRGDADVDYTITVPNNTPVEVTAISSDIDIDGVCGAVNLNSVSGDITLDCGADDVMVQSVSGDVSVTNVRGTLEAGSTSGDVDVSNARGSVNAHSVSGDISLDGIEGREIGAETVSGSIEFAGRLAQNGRYRFEAHSGDVTVRAAGSLNATISVSTFSGDFESDFPIVLTPGSRVQREWEFTLGNGGARLTLRSFSGGIYLRRGAGVAAPKREE
ncbi:MAG: DUF4097 family beta strand repeat-containing protein [Gemmatimonadales bacterium]|nr:DUF4097 family beta strand repeat-containing protein [Gemmatimonadales bacterium]